MSDRRRRLPKAPTWARNTLSSGESFISEVSSSQEPLHNSYSSAKPAPFSEVNSLRAPSPTSSDEEDTRATEKNLLSSGTKLGSGRTEREGTSGRESLSLLGDSSSLFATPPSLAVFTFRSSPPSATMVVEREPPKGSLSPQKASNDSSSSVIGKIAQQPEFGKASPLRKRVESGPFIIPKPHQPRPEHHRPAQPAYAQFKYPPSYPGAQLSQPTAQPPSYNTAHRELDVVEIPKPANYPTWSTRPTTAPLFSSKGSGAGFTAVNPQKSSNLIDLTTGYPLLDDQFGSVDPNDYVDAGKANENIKALLEGAFEDEEDKPRTRGRRKKVDAAVERLTDKLQGLEVKAEEKKEDENQEEEEEEEDDGTVEGLKVKLLPHQVDGVAWMKDKEIGVKKKNGVLPKGGILADDMGLGKTIQSISLILTNPPPPKTSTNDKNGTGLSNRIDKCTLVVGPLALIKQWQAEIKSKVNDSHKLKVCVHHGPQRTKRFEDLRKYDVVITTYQILVSEHSSSSEREDGPQFGCFGIHWYRVILDEAHTIKNRNAKATQACYALRAEYRWCLTGTPMQNNLDELQSLIRFLRIKPYNDLKIWKSQITEPMRAGRGGIAMKRLNLYLKAFMKRRTKEVLKKKGALNPGGKPTADGAINNGFKITERKVEKVSAQFTPEERSFYSRLEQRTDRNIDNMMKGAKLNYASALVMLLRLRQACNHPQLVGGSITQDQDAIATGQSQATQTPRKAKVVDKEVDEMADLLGGLSVQTKQCDMCQTDLTNEEAKSGALRCTECDNDLANQTKSHKHSSKHKKRHTKDSHTKEKAKPAMPSQRISKNRKVVLDDSDEDDDGDWLVPEDQRLQASLGKAGGSDDENAEGGGESIGLSDSETGDESSPQTLGSHRRKVISLDTTDDESHSDTQSSDDSTSESQDGSSPDCSILEKKSPTLSAKISHLIRLLRAESASHKFIVFSQFTSMLDLIEPFLDREKFRFTRYDGSMRNDHREASLERLRNDSKCRILLCSLKCGSLGLNLTAASRVVILEPFWNPFVEEQAIDRVHRLNQTRDVVVYKLTVADTVEARILELQEKKRALAEAAIEGKQAAGKLSMKDILKLFRRDAEHEHPVEVGRRDKGLLNRDMADSVRKSAGVEPLAAFRSIGTSNGEGRHAAAARERVRKEDDVYGRR